MNKLNILFLLDKTRINKSNKVPIRCRLTYKSIRKIFSTGLFINLEYWNSSKQIANPPNIENNQINTQLSLIKQENNQAFLYLQVQDKSFDVEDDRNLNAFVFSKSLKKTLNDKTYHWFLS